MIANTYPLPQTKFASFYIHSNQGANSLKGDGNLTLISIHKEKEYDTYTYDPGNPTPAWMFRFLKDGKKSYNEISTKNPELLVNDKIYEYHVDLWHQGITFEKDWKIRLEVISAFFLHFSRNLNTGRHNEMETNYVKAK